MEYLGLLMATAAVGLAYIAWARIDKLAKEVDILTESLKVLRSAKG